MSGEMTSFEKLMFNVKKFLIPVFFVVLGIIFIYLALSTRVGEYNKAVDGTVVTQVMKNTSAYGADRVEGHNMSMVLGAIACFVSALIAVFFVMGKIKKSVASILAILFIPVIGLIIWKLFSSIEEHEELEVRRELIREEIKLRLVDIREAQQAYFGENKVYTKDMDVLVDFIKTGKISSVRKFGSAPKRTITPEENAFLYGDNRAIDYLMSEEEAYVLSKSDICPVDLKDFRRDTVFVPVLDKVFLTDAKIESRKKNSRYPDFNADSLRYIPFTGSQPFTVEFDTIFQPMKTTVFKIEVLHPFLERYDDTVRIGNLEKMDLSGNWEQ